MAASDNLRAAQAALKNPNVKAFLDVIADAEGVANGYNTLFGNEVIQSLEDHPRQSRTFRETNGKSNRTTAAGRYQFLEKTWDDVASRLGLEDFSAESQDLAAVELLRRNGALEALQQGDFETAVQKSGGTWASLPSSPYAQPSRSSSYINDAITRARMSTGQPAGADINILIDQLMGPRPVNALDALTEQYRNVPVDLLSQVQNLTVPEELSPPAWMAELQNQQSISPQPLQPPRRSSAVATLAAEVPDDWSRELLKNGLNNMADESRSNAVSSFLGEEPVRRQPLPASLEQAIMRAISSV